MRGRFQNKSCNSSKARRPICNFFGRKIRNRGKFPGAVLGLGRCRSDKFGKRRNDLGAGDAKASP
jgi:hypothetical protein